MFAKKDITGEILQPVFQEKKFPLEEPIFIAFNKFLNTLGLDVALSSFHLKPYNPRESLHSGNGNTISIFIKTTINFAQNGFTEDGNWGGRYPSTEIIKDKWKQFAQEYGLSDEYYNFVSYVWVYDFEKHYLSHLYYLCKEDLIEKIKFLKQQVNPAYIFCSTEPSYNIIYQNMSDFNDAASRKYFDEIIQVGAELLIGEDWLKMFGNGPAKINFYHRELPNFNLYGFSRED